MIMEKYTIKILLHLRRSFPPLELLYFYIFLNLKIYNIIYINYSNFQIIF